MKTKGKEGRLLPIHELRDYIAAKYGAEAASHANLDPQLKKMRGDKLDMNGIQEQQHLTETQRKALIPGLGETFGYVSNPQQPSPGFNPDAHAIGGKKK